MQISTVAGRAGNQHLRLRCGLPRNLRVATTTCSMTKLLYVMKLPAFLFLGCSSNKSHDLITTVPRFLALITNAEEIKILLCCFQFFLFFSAALASSLLGSSPASAQSPVPLLLNPGLMPACGDHDGGGQSPLFAGRGLY